MICEHCKEEALQLDYSWMTFHNQSEKEVKQDVARFLDEKRPPQFSVTKTGEKEYTIFYKI
ncbi:MAG: hypothetical protein [Siphoviridae sp. ctvD11]|nr:MAG: hypothetical protein [Siphoviridae sp. ctvD11]